MFRLCKYHRGFQLFVPRLFIQKYVHLEISKTRGYIFTCFIIDQKMLCKPFSKRPISIKCNENEKKAIQDTHKK